MSNTPTANKSSAINLFFIFFIVSAILFAAFTDQMQSVTDASFSAAKSAVNLAIGLVGVMALWLGLVRVLEAGGLMEALAKKLKPVMVRLFPDVPAEHPAMSAMMLNMSANMLGLGNAATPLGIKAMVELNKLNPFKGTATNAMCLFLAINTSSVTLLPLGVIGVRAAAGADLPAAIFIPTLLATICSTIVAISLALWLAKRDTEYTQSRQQKSADTKVDEGESDFELEDFSHLRIVPSKKAKLFAWASMASLAAALVWQCYQAESVWQVLSNQFVTFWLMPILMLAIVLYGVSRGVKIYEAVTEGAKQGFDIAIRIIPFLVAILVAIGMFRASGAMDVLITVLQPVTSFLGMPADVLPMAIVRPLSGSGAFGVMSAVVEVDPNSYSAYVASVMQGSTETTFYVLAVYFGAVGVTKVRHAIVAALCADIVGIIMACIFSQMFFVAV